MKVPALFGVIGHPVSHSLSPKIHELFAQQVGFSLRYTKVLAPKDALLSTLAVCHRDRWQGVNITLPFKEQAYRAAATCTPRAHTAGAVNTLTRLPEGWAGDNTDGEGLLRDLTLNRQQSLRDQQIIILGAGGAVRGIMEPLLAASPKQVVIASRTLSKAEALREAFKQIGPVVAVSLKDVAQQQGDLLISALPAQLASEAPTLPADLFKRANCVYDLSYGTSPTWFQCVAQVSGAHEIVDGLGMLVEQAAASFRIWHGEDCQLDTQAVIRALRATQG